MKIKSSLKSIKKRDLNSKLVRRRGRVYIINKTNPNILIEKKIIFMDNENLKKRLNNFDIKNLYMYIWSGRLVLVLMALFLL